MTYGLTVKNDSNFIQIDSDTPRLCAIYSGTYAPSGPSSQVANISFPSPITTSEPPCIFIQNSRDYPAHLYGLCTINGTTGNWTGFSLRTINTAWYPRGKWFAAVFAAKTVADYGLRMWAADGSVIYDSGTTPIVFTRASHSWTYRGSTSHSQGSGIYHSNNAGGGPLLIDEYFMINPFSRGILVSNFGWGVSGVNFNYTNNSLQLSTFAAFGLWIDGGQPAAIFARLPGT